MKYLRPQSAQALASTHHYESPSGIAFEQHPGSVGATDLLRISGFIFLENKLLRLIVVSSAVCRAGVTNYRGSIPATMPVPIDTEGGRKVLGFGARFVTGYIQMAEGQHGATHAWTEIYTPGASRRGFDPAISSRQNMLVVVDPLLKYQAR
jgi:hypothetical protein